MLALLLASLIQGGPAPALMDPRRVAPSAIHDSLEASELRFFEEWREAYRLSEAARHQYPRTTASLAVRAHAQLRNAFTVCGSTFWGDLEPREGPTSLRTGGGAGSSEPGRTYAIGATLFKACPTWALGDSLPWDERVSIDAPLDSRFADPIRAARASIIALFDAGARIRPRDAWIAGQRVRLQIDQREIARAAVAARECAADVSWCLLLQGFAEARSGHERVADSLFRAGMREMTADERCRWGDASVLLDSAGRDAYRTATCTMRDSLNDRIWWLADPLWSEPGNERWVEQMTRAVFVKLHSDVDRDERYSWKPGAGGDALAEMVLRYGWPAYTHWSGPIVDYWRWSLLGISGKFGVSSASPSSPYTTFEYTGGRLHTLPAANVLADPFHSSSADWHIADAHDSTRRPMFTDASELSRAVNALNERISSWWPAEHFFPRAAIADLPRGQVAMLRRDSSSILATALMLDTASVHRPPSAGVAASLFLSSGPAALTLVSRAKGSPGSPLVLFGETNVRAAVASVEFSADSGSGAPGGRVRYGVVMPPSLASMHTGETAISDLVLLRPPAAQGDYPSDQRGILAMMSPSDTIVKGARLGLYWETYGFAASDTTEIAVWIERYTPQGILRRFGTALNIATDLNTPVSSSWTESGLTGRANIIPGRIPVVGRTVALDTSKLPAGDYWLRVVVRRPRGDPVESRRSFAVVAK
ncbi:MAG TPA: hypothetical protein VE967_04860 [Gemmatimonadaceae bacterium]|nr:hypothetical protein [Gemmatimonadaceae bacterium]